jgi:hypothetical protein
MAPLPRRLLLAAPALLSLSQARAHGLRPWRDGTVTLTPWDAGTAMLRADAIDGAVSVPASGARLAMMLPIAGRDVAGVAFGADTARGPGELLALIGWDFAGLRVLGLEVLSFTGVDGTALSARFSGVGDQTRLRVERIASVPAGPGKRREQWTDYLLWRDGGVLTDAPVRPAIAGSWQARLAAARAQVATMLAAGTTRVTAEMVAAVSSALTQ